MKRPNERMTKQDDIRDALLCIRQAEQILPEELSELLEDLQWIEESMEAALHTQEDEESYPFSSPFDGRSA